MTIVFIVLIVICCSVAAFRPMPVVFRRRTVFEMGLEPKESFRGITLTVATLTNYHIRVDPDRTLDDNLANELKSIVEKKHRASLTFVDLDQHLNKPIGGVQRLKLESERIGTFVELDTFTDGSERQPNAFVNKYWERAKQEVFVWAADFFTRGLEDLSKHFQLVKRSKAKGQPEVAYVLSRLNRNRETSVPPFDYKYSKDSKVYLGQEFLQGLEILQQRNTPYKVSLLALLAQRYGLDDEMFSKITTMLKRSVQGKAYDLETVPKYLQRCAADVKLVCERQFISKYTAHR